MSKGYRRNAGPVDYSDMSLSADELWQCYEKRIGDRTGDIVSHPNFPIDKLVSSIKKGPWRAGSWYVVYNPSVSLYVMSAPGAGVDTSISRLCASDIIVSIILSGMTPKGYYYGIRPRLNYLHEEAERKDWGDYISGEYRDCKTCVDSAIALHQYEVDRTGDLKPLTLDPKALGWVKHCLDSYAPKAVTKLKKHDLYPTVLEQATFSPNRRRR